MEYALVLRAAQFAVKAHGTQKRRYTGEPYMEHLFAVAQRVSEHTTDPHVIAAALLHDVVEDTSIPIEVIEYQFGHRIGEMVLALTDTPVTPGMNRAARKELDRTRIQQACANVQLIKAMDILDNMPSIVEHDPDFAKVFLKEKDLLVKSLNKLHPAIREQLNKTIEQEINKNE